MFASRMFVGRMFLGQLWARSRSVPAGGNDWVRVTRDVQVWVRTPRDT